MSFSTQVGKWTQHTAPDAVNEEMTAIVLDLFGSVIEDTPVDEGRLAANWQPSSKTPATGELASTNHQDTKRDVDDFVSAFDFSKKDFKVYLTNNLPYAHRIEYDGWSRNKAPEGMVRKNQIRVLRNLKTRI